VVIVPLHRTLARGTLGSILRQAGLTAVQLGELLA
jgi:predicted RNA binding protein YcfA (HicA-like mRNA interferase family)